MFVLIIVCVSRKHMPNPLPFDPDEECVEMEEMSHKDEGELSAQDFIASAIKGDDSGGGNGGSGDSAKDDSSVGGAPTRSIMRRASLFGSQSKVVIQRASSTGKLDDAEQKSSSSARPKSALGGMGGMLAEMQLKAAKRKERTTE